MNTCSSHPIFVTYSFRFQIRMCSEIRSQKPVRIILWYFMNRYYASLRPSPTPPWWSRTLRWTSPPEVRPQITRRTSDAVRLSIKLFAYFSLVFCVCFSQWLQGQTWAKDGVLRSRLSFAWNSGFSCVTLFSPFWQTKSTDDAMSQRWCSSF